MNKKMQSMDGFFDELWDDIKDAGQSAIDKAKQQALANVGSTVITDPNVQAAITQQTKEKAAQTLAQQMIAQADYLRMKLRENQKTILIVGGVAGLGLIAWLLLRKK